MTRAARSASANLIDEKTLRGRKLVSTRFSRRNEIEVRLPTSSERTDADVAKATIQALEWDAFIPPGKVKITLDKGRVTLEGSVDWQYQRLQHLHRSAP